MNNNVYLVKVNTDDYEALYIDGKIAFSEHRLDLSVIMESIIGYQLLGYTNYYIDAGVLEDKYGCEFPEYLISFEKDDLVK